MNPLLIHIPKTGGRTVIYHTGVKRFGHNTRNPDYQYPGEANLSEYDYIFSFIRNPLDRVVSAYHYLRLGGNNPEDKEDRSEYISLFPTFREFILDGLLKASERQMHFIPQAKFLEGVNCELFLFERIKPSVQILCELFGKPIPEIKKIVKGNQSDHEYFDDYYDQETRKVVREIYQKDFDLWNQVRSQ